VRHQFNQTSAILALQATAGNQAVDLAIQRAPAKGAAAADLRGEATMLAMHVSMLFAQGGRAYGPADTAGLSAPHATFMRQLYVTMFDRQFGSPNDYPSAREREDDLIGVRTMRPIIAGELTMVPEGKQALAQIDGAVSAHAADITSMAVKTRALAGAALESSLLSPEVVEARQSLIEGLQKGWKAYSKFSELVEATASVAARSETVGKLLKDAHTGLDVASKVVKALDSDSYTKAIDEAREWAHEHHAGAAMGTVKAVQVEAEIVELTLGTLAKVSSTLSKVAIFALVPKGSTLEAIEELAHAGEFVSGRGKAALKVAKFLEKLEKFETALNVIAIAGGMAKLVTAETNYERVDAGIDIGAGTLQVAAKLTGKAGLGAAASSVLMTWEMVKFFGEMGLGAIEGSFYGGFYQEMAEIRQKADTVGVAVVALGRAVEERDTRFGNLDVTNPERAGADDAVSDLAYKLQKELGPAEKRWRDAHIAAIGRAYGGPLRQEVAFALQPDYPASNVAETGISFMRELAETYRRAPYIVIDMAVDQGYMSPEKAEKEKAKLAKKAAGGKAE
jgi:hypothetical protein